MEAGAADAGAAAPGRLEVVLGLPAAEARDLLLVVGLGLAEACRAAVRIVHRHLARLAVAAPRNCRAAGPGHRSATDQILVAAQRRDLAAGQTSAPVRRNCRREEPAPVERVGGKSRRCHRPVPTLDDLAPAAAAQESRLCRPSARVPH